MSEAFIPKDYLVSNNWLMYHECDASCGKKQYFKNTKHPDHEIQVRPKAGTSVILEKNIIIASSFWSYLLPQTLKANNLL